MLRVASVQGDPTSGSDTGNFPHIKAGNLTEQRRHAP
jgi:hypothetical protein